MIRRVEEDDEQQHEDRGSMTWACPTRRFIECPDLDKRAAQAMQSHSADRQNRSWTKVTLITIVSRGVPGSLVGVVFVIDTDEVTGYLYFLSSHV